MNDVEDTVSANPVLILVHQQEHRTLQVDIEYDAPVEPGHLTEGQQVLASSAKFSKISIF